jgi:hypothetical protein
MKTTDNIRSSSMGLSCNEMSETHIQMIFSDVFFFHHISSARQNIQLPCLCHCSSPSNGEQYRLANQINSNRRNLTHDKNNPSHLLALKFSHREEKEFRIDN